MGREVEWFLKYPLYFPKSLNLSTHLPHFEPSLGGFKLAWPSCILSSRKTLHEIKEFSKKQNLDTVLDDLDQNQIKEILKEASFGKNA